MFDFNKIRRNAVAVAASAALLVSCVGIEEDKESAVGYLIVPSLEVVITVDDLLLTKALDFEVEEPSVSDIHFVVKDAAGNVKYDGKGLWSEPITLPVGAYSIDATYGSNGFGAPYFTGTESGSIEALEQHSAVVAISLANSLMRVTVGEELAAHFTPGTEVILNSGAYIAPYGEWFYVPSGSDISLSLAGTNSVGNDAEFQYTLTSPSAKVAYDVICEQKTAGWPSITLSSDLAAGAFEGGLYFAPAVTGGNISAENVSKMIYQVKGGEYADWTTVEVSDVEGYKYISGLSDNTSYLLRACIGGLASAESSFTPVTFASCLSTSASVSHTKNGSGELSGTEVNATVSASLPSIVADLSTVTVSGSFLNSASAERGSFSSAALTGGNVSVKMDNASGWPYIPQGAHTLNVDAVCTLPGGRVVNASVSKTGIQVPAPEFEVLLSAYTSYDKAKGTNNITKNVTEANNCDPATLYGISGGAKISVELLDNTNYGTKSFSVTLNDGASDRQLFVYENTTFGTNSVSVDNVSGLSWKTYTLTSSMTFDGKTIVKSNIHYITGLPYASPNFLSTSTTMKSSSSASITDWVSNGNVDYWSGRGYQLLYYYLGGVEAGNIFSPAFQVPESTSVQYTLPVCYFTTGLGAKSITLYTGVTASYSKVTTSSASISRVTSDNDPGIGKFTTVAKDDTMVANGRISISTDEGKDGNAAENWFTVASLNVLYR